MTTQKINLCIKMFDSVIWSKTDILMLPQLNSLCSSLAPYIKITIILSITFIYCKQFPEIHRQ